MKWFYVKIRIVENEMVYENIGGDIANSEEELRAKRMKSLRKAGWLSDDMVEFKMEISFDQKRTKHFDDNDLWGLYV